MELRTLRYFLAAAQEKNITKAADILHVTQPTLSRQLTDLERELGVTLTLRGKNGLKLTEDGELDEPSHSGMSEENGRVGKSKTVSCWCQWR